MDIDQHTIIPKNFTFEEGSDNRNVSLYLDTDRTIFV